jgi:hypothetical protein
MGTIASGDGGGANPRIELRDLNGDGRADYLHVKEDGVVTAYINMMSEAFGAGPTWLPLGTIASGAGVATRDTVVFGDLTGDGKTDYMVVNATSGAIRLWQNQGSGSAYRPGQSIFLADLDGDGRADFVYLQPDGKATAYTNGGPCAACDSGKGGWLVRLNPTKFFCFNVGV